MGEEGNAADRDIIDLNDLSVSPAESTMPVTDPGNTTVPEGTDSLIPALLAERGIADPTRIKFEDVNGKVTEKDWKDLGRDERLNILKTPVGIQLTDEERSLIDRVRESGTSVEDYLNSLTQEVQVPAYEIDGMSDDELFILDAMDRYGEDNITDEQLETMLQNAKSDPDLYARNIASLREQYMAREDDQKLEEQQQLEARREQEYERFSEDILKEIRSLTSVAGQAIELSTDDMNDLANYILTRDENGNTEFGKAMNDPKVFTQAAFWALKGNDIMAEIASQIKMAYERGVEAGKRGYSPLYIDRSKDKTSPVNAGHSSNIQAADALDVS